MRQQLQALLRATLSNPREGASLALNYAPSRVQLFQMAALVAALGAIVAVTLDIIAPAQTSGIDETFGISPFAFFFLQLSGIYLSAIGAFAIGRAFGGTGSFDEALLLLIWLQAVMLCVQIVQFVAVLVYAPLSTLVFWLSLVLFLWLFVSFVAVLHGFTSLMKVLLGTIGSIFVISFAIAFLLALVGVGA